VNRLSFLRDIGLIGRFELFRAIRTWRALAQVLVYVVVVAGSTRIFISALRAMENTVAEQMGVPAVKYPGTLTEQVMQSDSFHSMMSGMFGDQALIDALIGWHPIAWFFFWLGIGLFPFLAASSASEAIATDVQTRTIRFQALRTGRLEIVLGRWLGQLVLSALAVSAGAFAAMAVCLISMVEQDVYALATGLGWFGLRVWLFGIPFVGLGLACSQVTTSPAWARVMAIVGVAGSWLVFGLTSNRQLEGPWAIAADLVRPLLPQGWLRLMWESGAVWMGAGAVCVGLGLVATAIGYVGFARRDL
jgi:ABC-type transport system involved in multi-copper enzyme maturation permease subunit